MVPEPVTEPHGAPTVPGYEIEGVIARGATGVVYRARQLAFGRKVALKVLLPELVGRGRPIRRLQREARLAAQLAHPNLVSSIDMGEALDGRWWHAMELVEGPSLAILIHREGHLSERAALRLFTPLADALAHMAEAGVVHRDIKPGNILVEPNGRPWLVDFGLAFADGDPSMTRPGGTLGTPHYVSPEQARDPTRADTRSDIWSLGATLYHAVCGVPPFVGESVAEILSGVLYGSVVDPRVHRPELSKGLSLVLRKCLTRDPARRYQHPEELLEDLERLRERRAVRVRRRDLDPVARDHAVRRRWVVAGGALGVLALGALFVLAPWRSGEGAVSNGTRAEAGYEPLDRLASRVREDPGQVGPALRELAEIAPAIPKEHSDQVQRTREILEQRSKLEVGRRSAELSADLVADLRENRFERALERIEGFRGRLARELQLDSMQQERFVPALDLARERANVEAAIASYVDVQGKLLASRFDATVGREVEDRVRGQEWRVARELLEEGAATWLAANLGDADLPPRSRSLLEAEFERTVLAERRRALLERWSALDLELAVSVATESERLSALLEEGALAGDPTVELEKAFDRELERRGLTRAALLSSVSMRALHALEENGAILAGKARELADRDARIWLAARDREVEPLAAARRFGEVASFWHAQLELDVVRPVSTEVRLREREAELLDDLLDAAAERLRALEGRTVELFLGGVLARGRIVLVGDPRRDGFEFVLEAGSRPQRARLAPGATEDGVRVLEPEALERLAELAPLPADAQGGRWLARILLRFREGQRDVAARLLSDSPPELEPRDAELYFDLLERVERARSRDAAEQARDLEDAQQLLRTLNRLTEGGHVRDKKNALATLDRLLGPLLYLDFVQERKKELRELRRTLISPEPRSIEERFAEAYGAHELDLSLAIQRFRLAFDFGRTNFRSNDTVGTWRRPSDWLADASGWYAGSRATIEQLDEDARWPRLVLTEPLVIDDTGVFVARFRLRQLEDSGRPELLVLSVAGWHVALATSGITTEPRWLAVTGGTDALEKLAANLPAEGHPCAGLEAGRTYVVEVRLSGARGRLRLSLAAVEGFGPTETQRTFFEDRWSRLAPPAGAPGTQSIVVRSLEPVRLERVEIEGAFR